MCVVPHLESENAEPLSFGPKCHISRYLHEAIVRDVAAAMSGSQAWGEGLMSRLQPSKTGRNGTVV
jgi:hypothetical protein